MLGVWVLCVKRWVLRTRRRLLGTRMELGVVQSGSRSELGGDYEREYQRSVDKGDIS